MPTALRRAAPGGRQDEHTASAFVGSPLTTFGGVRSNRVAAHHELPLASAITVRGRPGLLRCSTRVGRRATRAARACAHCAAEARRGGEAPHGSAAATRSADGRACRVRTRARRSRMCAGGIHDSGSRPISNSSRRWRASARSVFARFFLPFNAAASAGSARCTSAPTRWSSSTTNRHPVVASNATSRPTPLNCAKNRRTAARSAGATRARESSPVIVSIHSAEICARC